MSQSAPRRRSTTNELPRRRPRTASEELLVDSNSDDDDDDDVLQSTFEAARRNFAPPSRGLEAGRGSTSRSQVDSRDSSVISIVSGSQTSSPKSLARNSRSKPLSFEDDIASIIIPTTEEEEVGESDSDSDSDDDDKTVALGRQPRPSASASPSTIRPQAPLVSFLSLSMKGKGREVERTNSPMEADSPPFVATFAVRPRTSHSPLSGGPSAVTIEAAVQSAGDSSSDDDDVDSKTDGRHLRPTKLIARAPTSRPHTAAPGAISSTSTRSKSALSVSEEETEDLLGGLEPPENSAGWRRTSKARTSSTSSNSDSIGISWESTKEAQQTLGADKSYLDEDDDDSDDDPDGPLAMHRRQMAALEMEANAPSNDPPPDTDDDPMDVDQPQPILSLYGGSSRSSVSSEPPRPAVAPSEPSRTAEFMPGDLVLDRGWPGVVVAEEGLADSVLEDRPAEGVFYCVQHLPHGDPDWATPKDLKRLRKESLDLSNKLGTARTAFKIATDEAKLAAWKEKYIAAPPAPVEPPAAMTEAGQPETASVKTVEEDKAEGEERRKILQRPDNPPDVQVMKEEAQPNRGPAALVSKPSPAAEDILGETKKIIPNDEMEVVVYTTTKSLPDPSLTEKPVQASFKDTVPSTAEKPTLAALKAEFTSSQPKTITPSGSPAPASKISRRRAKKVGGRNPPSFITDNGASTFLVRPRQGAVSPDPMALSPVFVRHESFERKPIIPAEELLPAEEVSSAFQDRLNQRPDKERRDPINRLLFEAMIQSAALTDKHEIRSPLISVINKVDPAVDPCPPFEFAYINNYLYGAGVPRKSPSQTGCGCWGACRPWAGCSCAVHQAKVINSYIPDAGIGDAMFAYTPAGTLFWNDMPVFECTDTCECDEDRCRNRVVGRGRKAEVAIAKTEKKGWGIEATGPIARNQFIGRYAGELITNEEADIRGDFYDKVGKTYLLALDAYHLKQNGLKLKYTIDAFFRGFTRYFNHSCDPNMRLEIVYLDDFDPDKPLFAFFATRDIQPGEELCFSYTGSPGEGKAKLLQEEQKRKNASSRKSKITDKGKLLTVLEHSCQCGTDLCDGTMFAEPVEDDELDEMEGGVEAIDR